jgi:CRISPR/Cas system CSM-associated protein Csm3 (group 7 of RAMP superfamily)
LTIVVKEEANSTALDESQKVVRRVFVTGVYKLISPAHFGSGESADTDMLLVRGADGSLLIPGSSLAGVCRSYLAHYLVGATALPHLLNERNPENIRDQDVRGLEKDAENDRFNLLNLFGGIRDEGDQSALLFSDALCLNEVDTNKDVSIRDGVSIDSSTGQAKAGAKYDLEIVERDTSFTIRLELVLRSGDNCDQLKALLNLILQGFEAGEIRLGAKTRRGYGLGKVARWYVQEYDFSRWQDTLAWIKRTEPAETNPNRAASNYPAYTTKQAYFDLTATFRLTRSLQVRAYSDEAGLPDMSQILSRGQPVIPGTSIAGAIRHRAERIVRSITANEQNEQKADELICSIFGYVNEAAEKTQQVGGLRASRLRVEEEWITDTVSEVQTRVSIDRFTGGVRAGLLFEEMPVWGNEKRPARWQLRWRLWHPERIEIGLLLQVLKDLWLGDLAIGGGAGIGRGVLQGEKATLTLLDDATNTWLLDSGQSVGQIIFQEGTATELNQYAEELFTYLNNQGS